MARRNTNKTKAATTYADGSIARYNPATGRLEVVRPDGTVVDGATPFATGQGVGYGNVVDTLAELPAGSFDPNLLWESLNKGLGHIYDVQDFETNFGKYTLGADGKPAQTFQVDADGNLVKGENEGRAFEDYWNQRGALGEALARAREDYTTGTETLGRNYRTLGNNQLQDANQRGLMGGGALAQALAKRTENQGREQAGLDQSWARYSQDNSRAVKDLSSTFRRGFADGTVNLGRGAQVNDLYQAGLFNSAVGQANQSGYLVDNPSYQTHNGVLYQVTPTGERVPVKRPDRNKPPKAPKSFTGYAGGYGYRDPFTGDTNPFF